jgi:hypothetical protein
MGITAEKVAEQFNLSRADQDAFAVESDRKTLAAIAAGEFNDEIAAYTLDDPRQAQACVQSCRAELAPPPLRVVFPEPVERRLLRCLCAWVSPNL